MSESFGLPDIIFGITGFELYSWYINMYIGLFLMIPFINAAWNSIKEKSGHKIFLAAMIFITVAPSFFNIFDFHTPGALLQPWLSTYGNRIVPDWWTGIYPVTYYLIGAYIKKYIDIKKLSTWRLTVLFLSCVIFFGIFNIFRSKSINFVWGEWCIWGGFQNTVDSVLAFLLINSFSYRKMPALLKKGIKYIAGLTLGAYLLSWIPDTVLYPRIIAKLGTPQVMLNYFPVIVGAIIAISLILSFVDHLLTKLLHKVIKVIKSKKNMHKAAQ